MAKMGGCNSHMGGTHTGESQGKNRGAPSRFARNVLSKGGVNKDLGGGAKSGSGGSVKAGGASQGKHKHMPKGY